MPRYEASVEVAKPVEEVFYYMNDVGREREWQPHLIEAEQIPPGLPGVGTRRRFTSEFLGKRVENTYVVRLYEENTRVVLESTEDSSVRSTTDVRWERIASGTRVTMAVEGEPAGALKLIPDALAEKAFGKEVDEALERVKEILERSA